MKLLFVGGTGIISSACARLAVKRGAELDLVVRGQSGALRPPPPEANQIKVDIRRPDQVAAALGDRTYDAVVDFVSFTPGHIETALELFGKRAGQLVFISSASAYHKPVRHLPITESTPLHNPFWQYSRDKIACEEQLMRAYRDGGTPITIVRPSHTYDRTLLPFDPHGAGPTILSRLDRGLPIVVHGDGTSLWTLTHHADFAVGLFGLLGHPAAIGEAFHITSDEILPWNEVVHTVARAAGRKASIVHVPSAIIAAHHPAWGAGLLGDKAHSVMFDNSKIRRLVPEFAPKISFAEGAREIVAFYRSRPELCRPDPEIEAVMDELVSKFSVR